MISRFFKLPSHQRFQYIPRHYNPEKEELESKLASRQRSKRNLSKAEIAKERISNGLRRHNSRVNNYSNEVHKANVRILFILIALVILCVIMINRFLPFIELFLNM